MVSLCKKNARSCILYSLVKLLVSLCKKCKILHFEMQDEMQDENAQSKLVGPPGGAQGTNVIRGSAL